MTSVSKKPTLSLEHDRYRQAGRAGAPSHCSVSALSELFAIINQGLVYPKLAYLLIHSRRLVAGPLSLLLAAAFSWTAVQAKVDNRNLIELVAQQPPGSLSETISRIWAECAARKIGHPIYVVNKPGANGVVAVNYLKQRPGDGSTIMTIGMSQLTITPYVYKHAPYDPLNDFENIAVLTTNSLFLVASLRSGVTQLEDITRVAQSKTGGLDYGSPGKGSPSHLLTAAVIRALKTEGTHVPFTGEGDGVLSLLRGDVDLMTLTSGTAAPLIKAGRVAPLAVYALERSRYFPTVPTITELTGQTALARPGWLARGQDRHAAARYSAAARSNGALRDRRRNLPREAFRGAGSAGRSDVGRRCDLGRPRPTILSAVHQSAPSFRLTGAQCIAAASSFLFRLGDDRGPFSKAPQRR
jgi:tripartite-type tricarboxylate transporter receptor subunit TctC